MGVKIVLFDLDGTLLPMDQDLFISAYFNLLVKHLEPHGYEPLTFSNAFWSGTKAMMKNDGSKTNEKAFWEEVSYYYGEKAKQDVQLFNDFYAFKFDEVKKVCEPNPQAAAAVWSIKDKGLRVALATNPLFPVVATEKRISWTGLKPADFEFYTTFEDYNYCKPNPEYFKAVIERAGVAPEECLMVGNDVDEDMVAQDLGMKVFLLTDCLINKSNKDISVFPNGSFEQLIDYIDCVCQ